MAAVRSAWQLYFSNLGLLVLLVTTVYLPINAIIFYAVNYVLAPDDLAGGFRITMLLESIFGPIATGSVIYVVWQASQRSSVTYGEALQAGLSCWGRMFATRLVAGLIIFLGLLAFIVPGILLAIRFALIDSAVVVEGIGGRDARSRSTDLTQGIRVQIILLSLAFYTLFMIASVVLYVPLEFLPVEASFVEILIDCVGDVMFAFVDVLFFVLFWNARGGDDHATQDDDDEFPPVQNIHQDSSDLTNDLNPYRPPEVR